jgi:hypothetical protein
MSVMSLVYIVRAFSFYSQASDVGKTHRFAPTAVRWDHALLMWRTAWSSSTVGGEQAVNDVPTHHLLPALFKASEKLPIHNHPEDGNCNVCRNVGELSTFPAAHPRKPKLYMLFFFIRPLRFGESWFFVTRHCITHSLDRPGTLIHHLLCLDIICHSQSKKNNAQSDVILICPHAYVNIYTSIYLSCIIQLHSIYTHHSCIYLIIQYIIYLSYSFIK